MFKEDKLKQIEEEYKKYEANIAKMKQKDEKFETDNEIEVKPIYTPLDIKNKDYLKDIGFPGAPPFTRGVYPTMYRSQFWTIRLFSGFGTPESTNKRWKYLYSHGETGFSAAVDALTFNGIDPDDSRADLEVGTAGVPLYCIDSMFALTEGLPLEKVSVALVVEPFSSAPICAMFYNMAMQKGYQLSQITGTCQNDICTHSIEFN